MLFVTNILFKMKMRLNDHAFPIQIIIQVYLIISFFKEF